jgi:hypothetical protein
MIDKIKQKYGESILRRSALNLPNGAEDIKKFMTIKPIKIAIEIGTFRGITSAWMSQFCDRLYTVDLLDGQVQQPLWKDLPMRGDIWKYLEIPDDKIWFQPVKCNNSKERFLKKINFDFAFVDGDHSYEGVKKDFELVKRCGRVLFHDYDKAPGKACPVRDFINSIKEGTIETTKDFAYWEDK